MRWRITLRRQTPLLRRSVYAFAIEYRHVTRNPANDVKYLKGNPEGFHSWSDEEIKRFEVHHRIGSRARLALALLLYTGQRRSDVVLFGRQHLRDGWLHFTQRKNRSRNPITLAVPVAPEHKDILDATPSNVLTFLVTEFGRPFTASVFGNRFRKWCDEAGLPKHCSAHGLRKAAASRLAEAGASEKEIGAVTGHRTSKEVSRYTRAANQKTLARSAMDKLNGNKSVPLEI
jgi:integrase